MHSAACSYRVHRSRIALLQAAVSDFCMTDLRAAEDDYTRNSDMREAQTIVLVSCVSVCVVACSLCASLHVWLHELHRVRLIDSIAASDTSHCIDPSIRYSITRCHRSRQATRLSHSSCLTMMYECDVLCERALQCAQLGRFRRVTVHETIFHTQFDAHHEQQTRRLDRHFTILHAYSNCRL